MQSSQGSSGLSALQSMAMLGSGSSRGSHSLSSTSSKDLLAQSQQFIKEQQKLLPHLPPAQRKAYEALLAEMKQAAEQRLVIKSNSFFLDYLSSAAYT